MSRNRRVRIPGGARPRVLSDLQAAWDEVLSRRNFFLVFCGSSVSMFETEVLGLPLYGRWTGSWRVEPLSFRDARSFIPRYGFEDAVRVWAAAGGVPMHRLTTGWSSRKT